MSLICAVMTGCNGGGVSLSTRVPPGDSGTIIGAEAHPRLAISPTSIDFGDVPVGFPVSQVVTLSNSGNAVVTVSAASLTGAGFSHDLMTPLTLAAGQVISFNLSFSPTTAGSVTGGLSITSNAENTPTLLALSGNAVGPAAGSLTASPSSITFGDTIVGTGTTQTVTLTNGGATTLTVTSATVTGADFNVTGLATPLAIGPGQAISFSVQFFPMAAGAASGSISIASDAPNSPNVITVSGNGIDPVLTLSVSPTNVDFGDVTVGSNSSQTVTVTNTGNSSVTISSSTVSGAGFSTTGLTTPLTLTAGQSSAFTVRFAPAATGAVSGSVSLTSNATNSPTVVSLDGNGTPAPAGQLAANPTSLDFGDVIVGNLASQTVTITNTGNANATISASSVTGAGFSTAGLTLPLTLTPGQNTTFSVRFGPGSAGSSSGNLTLTSNASNSPHVISLSGNGIAQVKTLSANPTSIDFGDVTVGVSASQSVTVTNTGNVNVTVSSSTVTGAGVSTSGLALPLTLTPGQSTAFMIMFAPSAAGALSGNVSLTSDATNSPTVIALTGNAVPAPVAELTVNPTSINFGSVVVGSTDTRVVTMTNTGTVDITVTAVTPSGAGFSISGIALPVTLSVGQSTTFNAVFTPAAAGLASGNVVITSNASNSPTVALSGTGLAQTPTLSVSPTNINFGDVAVTASSNQTVTVTNVGNANVTITSAPVAGAGFSISGLTLPLTLTPGQSSTFTATFAPGATGPASGSVSLTSNATNSPNVVMFSGNGTPAPAGVLTPNPTSINFGSVIVGNAVTQSVMLTNTGNASLTITASSASGAGFSITGLTLPLTLNVGQSSSFTARFAPGSAGAASGNITFTSNASNSPTISLSGTGVAQTLTLSASPTSINFGDVTVGMMSSQSITVTNTGNASVTISSSSVTGASFSITGLTLPLTLNAGQSTMFSAVFTPASGGAASGNVTLTSNATNSPTTVSLSGNGVVPVVNLTVTPLSINFGDVSVGSPSSQVVTLLNSTASSITITDITVVGAGFSFFLEPPLIDPPPPTPPPALPRTLAPGEFVTMSVSFNPATIGPSSGTVSIISTATNSPINVTLAGNGVVSVILAWDPSTSVVVGYEVLRGTRMGGPYAILNASLVTTTMYTDRTVQAAQTYFYVVRAVDATGQKSGLSNEVSVTIP